MLQGNAWWEATLALRSVLTEGGLLRFMLVVLPTALFDGVAAIEGSWKHRFRRANGVLEVIVQDALAL